MSSEGPANLAVLAEPVSYKHFYKHYILKNQPCLLTSHATEHWSCRRNWVQKNRPHIHYLTQQYGHLEAPVVDCNKRSFSSHDKCDMKVKEYFDYWINRGERSMYLKDWHLQMKVGDESFYEVPVYFVSDWLNEYWDKQRDDDDYRFVYIGVKGTWTPFHADVFRSFSWSANVCGLKKWLLYPPGEEEMLKDKFGRLPFDVTQDTDADMYPRRRDAREPIVVLQKEGEIIFVPSGWHHQVYNLEDTISVNHNWVNACCIGKMWEHLCDELRKVRKEIEDCKDMDGFLMQCQVILKASSGMDLKEFFEVIALLMETRLELLNAGVSRTNNEEELKVMASHFYITSLPRRPYNFQDDFNVENELELTRFDLSKLVDVMEKLINHKDFVDLYGCEYVGRGKVLLDKVKALSLTGNTVE